MRASALAERGLMSQLKGFTWLAEDDSVHAGTCENNLLPYRLAVEHAGGRVVEERRTSLDRIDIEQSNKHGHRSPHGRIGEDETRANSNEKLNVKMTLSRVISDARLRPYPKEYSRGFSGGVLTSHLSGTKLKGSGYISALCAISLIRMSRRVHSGEHKRPYQVLGWITEPFGMKKLRLRKNHRTDLRCPVRDSSIAPKHYLMRQLARVGWWGCNGVNVMQEHYFLIRLALLQEDACQPTCT